jgi:hypothetical protein
MRVLDSTLLQARNGSKTTRNPRGEGVSAAYTLGGPAMMEEEMKDERCAEPKAVHPRNRPVAGNGRCRGMQGFQARSSADRCCQALALMKRGGARQAFFTSHLSWIHYT